MSIFHTISSVLFPPFHWQISGKSIAGAVRKYNEDYVLFSEQEKGGIAILADGVGGHNAGEVAAQFVCEELLAWFESKIPSGDAHENSRALQSAIESIHDCLYLKSQNQEEHKGMATTLAMVVQHHRCALIAWAGDSRIYLWRKFTLKQLSEDHSFVEEKVREGLFSQEDADKHPMGNIITSCLGAKETMPHLGIKVGKLKRGDKILLVSDGVSDVLGENDLIRLVPEGPEAVLDAAQVAFSTDNCSAVIVSVN